MAKQLLKPLYRVYESLLERDLDKDVVPRHIGIILDGHRRYARSEGLPDYAASYRVGMEKFEEFLGWAHDLHVPAITGWLLSTHNLERPQEELAPYFEVLIELFERLPQRLAAQDMAVRFIGSLDLLPSELVAAAKKLEERCSKGSRRLTMALGYGGRQEIVDAVRELIAKLAQDGIESSDIAEHVDVDTLQAHLYTADLPDPDLVIRTSGESRLSGFLLWQSAYAEYVFVDVHWPAFRRVDFLRSVRDFARRDRRFGK
ncbi:MAG: polyprenyl diphosphate synthase [Acidimicrobiia bacterium]|nr:polyprenyl diphosphate synthase [Acidimicrobiia bacterium]